MSEKDQQQQQELTQSIKITIKFQGKTLLPLDVTPSDTLLEIKQFLSDSTILYFYTSYHFTYEKKPVNEYVDIGQLNLKDEAELDVELDLFDERSAKLHVKRVCDCLSNPTILSQIYGNTGAVLNVLKGFDKPDSKDDQNNKTPEISNDSDSEKDDDKKNQNQQQQINQQQSQSGGKQNIKEQQYTLNDALRPSLANKLICSQKKSQNNVLDKCVQFINYSGFNPPPTYRKLKGDFFYLHIRVLENIVYHISACPLGFYINKSNQKYFDPEPAQHSPAFTSIIDLLKQISPQFNANFEKLIKLEPDFDNYELPQLSFFKYGHKWLIMNQYELKSELHEWNMNKCENSLINLYGFDAAGIRDWNEELQICRDLPKTDFIQKLNRDKALIKVYSDFVEAAVEGAKAVVEKNIQPLNPMDSPHQQVYVYNHIFFSFALENLDNFRQETGPDASPTVSTANCDLRNLKILHKLDIPGLHVLNTVLIDYKGYRVIAQSIIPGILNSDHSNCSQYGSIDDGKTICNNEEFHEIMKKVCEYFSLDDSIQFYDESKKIYTLAGSIEVKGIRGSDRRKYILDLMRLSPRDLNYKDQNEHLCCVLRQELINNFIMTKSFEAAQENYSNLEKLQQKEKKNEKGEKIDDQQESMNRFLKLQEYLQKNENQFKLKLNPNLFTKAPNVDSDQTKKQIDDLETLSKFLISKAIPNVISDLINNGDNGRLSDSTTIEECFHMHGVNMRYLGEVYKQIDKKENPHLIMILERVILVKCLKHILREIMREAGSLHLTHALAHALNCIFSSPKIIQLLNNGTIKGDSHVEINAAAIQTSNQQEKGANGSLGGQNADQKGDQKKKKKKKKKQVKKDDETEQQQPELHFDHLQQGLKMSIAPPKCLSKKPKDFWQQIVYIAQKRYQHNFPENMEDFKGFKYNFNKLSVFRDLCLSVGLQIECSDYDLRDTSQSNEKDVEDKTQLDSSSSTATSVQKKENGVQQHSNNVNLLNLLPFKASNIINITPIIKHIDFESEDAKQYMDIGQKYLMEQKCNEPLESFHSAVQILMNLFGPIHKDIGQCYSKIASIHFKMQDIDHAIFFQKQAINIFKRFYGIIHYQTAQAFQNLGFFYFGLSKNYKKAFKYMLKSLFIYSLIGGEAHPDAILAFMNLSLMYQDSDQHQASLSCLFEALDRNISIFGKDHLKIVNTYQAIALAHFEIDDIKRAIEYQEKCVNILQKQLKMDDIRLKEPTAYLLKFQKALQEKKKNQSIKAVQEGGNSRGFGQNKPVQQKQQQKDLEEEKQFEQFKNYDANQQQNRDILKQKLRMAKMNAKYGYRRNMDFNRFILQQAALSQNQQGADKEENQLQKIK